METNSKEYWEQRFSNGDWEKYDGDLQSAFFSQLFVREMPRWLRDDLNQNSWKLADYGCAEGGGTAVLGREFPACSVTGYDFSETAISNAKAKHLGCYFEVADIFSEIPETDVIFSSNTLEHLRNPLEIMRRLVEASRKHAVFMLPFEDDYGFPEHINTFTADIFPDTYGGHYLSFFKVIDCREQEIPYWPGKQILLVYTNGAFRKPSNYSVAEFYGTCVRQYVEEAYQKKLDEKALRDELTGMYRRGQDELNNALLQKQTAEEQLVLQRDELNNALCQKQTAEEQLALLQDELNNALYQKQTTEEQLALQQREFMEQKQISGQKLEALHEELGQLQQELNEVRAQKQNAEESLEMLRRELTEHLKNMNADYEQLKQNHEQLKAKSESNANTLAMALRHAQHLATTRKFKFLHLITRMRRQLLSRDRRERRNFFKWVLKKIRRVPEFDSRYNPIYEIIDILKRNTVTCIAPSEEAWKDAVNIDMSALSLQKESKLAQHCSQQETVLDAAIAVPDNDEVIKLRKAINEREYKGILIYPHIVYWEPLQTPQQLLRAFARNGWLCLFCEHPNLSDQFREVEPNLFITGEAEVVKAIGNHRAVVMLTWMGSLPFVKRIPNSAIWYHILDHLEIFSYYDDSYLQLHNSVVQSASVVSYVAEPLKKQYALGDRAIYLPNGVNPEEIKDAIHPDFVPEDMKPILAKNHKIVGYYGYLAEWMDYEMIRWLADIHPDYEFVMIGKAIHDTGLIENVSNIHLLGLKPYKELFDYAKYFDVATIPFVLDEKMDCVSPIKFYEYMALGKPVVSSSMPEVFNYAIKCSCVFNANSRDEFNYYLERAMLPETAAEAEYKGVEFAVTNSWDARAKTIQLSLKQADNSALNRFSTCPDIIQFAIIDYNFRFQRPQHLARRMAQHGHRVFYVNTAFVPGDGISVEQTEENVYQIFLPFHEDISIHCTDLSSKMEHLKKLLDKFVYDWVVKDAVIIADYPNWIHAADHLKRKYGFRIITDYMDDYTGFLNPAEEIVRENCIKLLNISDRIVASSNFLYDIASKYSDSVDISRNGTEFEYFHKIVNNNRPANHRPIIGYYGAIAEWFNVDVVCRCAERFPNCDVVLVGNVSAHRQKLEAYSNIRLVGEIPYTELLPWLDSFDVCLIPFDTSTDLIKATNPVKFYEYLSAGKKIVATEIPELLPYKNRFVYLENDPEKFCDMVELCLNNQDSLADCNSMYEFAKENDWDSRAEDFEEAIRKVYPKISVVVLCYNQLEYTRQCVESILNYTAYPNYELILVDNNSSDDTAEYLKSIAGKTDKIKLVLNQTNRGFAGGNNDGIAVSNGEYIVLLNNDTVITKGWLTGLLKHFAEDGSVALVGPITNSIGNEGKILVDYSNIHDMPIFAHEYTSAHMGEEYPHCGILAMFCLMISRAFYEKAGPLDEKYGIGMFEDDDYSTAAMKMGYKIVMAEDVFIHHYGTVSFKKLENETYMKIFNENRKYFEKKWNTKWERQTMRPGVPMN